MVSDYEYWNNKVLYDPETGLLHWKNGAKSGQIAGSAGTEGRIRLSRYMNGKQVFYFAHRIAWLLHYGEWPPHEIDHHPDQNPANNRINNLRLATHSQNQQNTGVCRSSISGRKGVYPHYSSSGRAYWRVAISVDKKRYNLGVFQYDQLEEAAECYRQAAAKYHGVYARMEKTDFSQRPSNGRRSMFAHGEHRV